MRCEKTKTSFEAFVSFACTLILVKSFHRTWRYWLLLLEFWSLRCK